MDIKQKAFINYEGDDITIDEYRDIAKKKGIDMKSLTINSKQVVDSYKKEYENMIPSETKSVSLYVNNVKKNKYILQAIKFVDVDKELLKDIQNKSVEEIITIIDILKEKKRLKTKDQYKSYYSAGTSSFVGVVSYLVSSMFGLDVNYIKDQIESSDIFNTYLDEISFDIDDETDDKPISPYVKIIMLMSGSTVITALIHKYAPNQSWAKMLKNATINKLKTGDIDGFANVLGKIVDNPITNVLSGNKTVRKKRSSF